MHQVIGFIGGGNMAEAIIGGLLNNGYPAAKIKVVEPLAARREALESKFSIETRGNSAAVVADCELLILAVKPQIMKTATLDLASLLKDPKPVFISIAAGITIGHLSTWLGSNAAIVRVMPNTPALVGRGAAALYANPQANDSARHAAETVMQAVGTTVWVDDEAQLDIVTALSGSGPAYFFLLLELLEKHAVELGLAPSIARQLAIQTAIGSAHLAEESAEPLSVLREKVTSPGGTTEAALNSLSADNIDATIGKALRAARQRSVQLAEQFS